MTDVAPKTFQDLSKITKKPRVLVVGDVMLDVYIEGDVVRISPEAPVPVFLECSQEQKPGGAANVALCLSYLGADVSLCARVGSDKEGEALVDSLGDVNTDGVVEDLSIYTTTKTRFLGTIDPKTRTSQHVMRWDREVTSEGSPSCINKLIGHFGDMHEYDAVVVSDYGKGIVTEALLSALYQIGEKEQVFIYDPPHPKYQRLDLCWLAGFTMITPNHEEALAMVPNRGPDEMREIVSQLALSTRCDSVLLTMGVNGMYLYSRSRHGDTSISEALIPARQVPLVDVTGAGDMVVAVLAYALSSGMRKHDAAWLANFAAGMEVGLVGATPIPMGELYEAERSGT
jgi:D-beta-D-heptose 7-phosphate kinase/D-beta-D-heptose 1-phosphate adenosyltransferase